MAIIESKGVFRNMFSSIAKQAARLSALAVVLIGVTACGINAVPTQDE